MENVRWFTQIIPFIRMIAMYMLKHNTIANWLHDSNRTIHNNSNNIRQVQYSKYSQIRAVLVAFRRNRNLLISSLASGLMSQICASLYTRERKTIGIIGGYLCYPFYNAKQAWPDMADYVPHQQGTLYIRKQLTIFFSCASMGICSR